MLKELSAVKKEMPSMKTSLPSDVLNKEVHYYLHCVFIIRNKLSRMMSCNYWKLPNVISNDFPENYQADSSCNTSNSQKQLLFVPLCHALAESTYVV